MIREPSLPAAFAVDGSFRDIYVLETSGDWREFLKLVTGSHRSEFLVDLQPRQMPEDPAPIFEQREETPVLLKIFLDGVQINCHFFGGDIELDLDPREVHTREDVDRVLNFLKELGDGLNRTVLLTAENASYSVDYSTEYGSLVYYRYEPYTAAPEPVDR